MELNDLIDNALQRNASDIHIATNHAPAVRVYGEIIYLRSPALTHEQVMNMLHSIMTDVNKKSFEDEWEVDFSFRHQTGNRMRINAFTNIHGPAAVMRIIPSTIKSLAELDSPKILEKICGLHKGLVLVTGPTGSGKSTTMAAMINHINNSDSKHILIIEDPIEFTHKSNKSHISQREIGVHSKSFARALKSALREDPDVIMIGEMRDKETIHLALTAAETGHLVIGTLHTSSAAQTIDRVIDVFPSEDKPMIRTMLSNSLEAVISQQLIKKSDASGRVAAHEIMIVNNAIRNLIREGKIPQIPSMIQTGGNLGMQLLKDCLTEMVDKKLISKASALEVLNVGEEIKPANPVNAGLKSGF